MEEKKTPRKPLIFYYFVVMMVLMLLNALVFPSFLRGKITEVDYGTFLSQVDSGNVLQVEVDESQIAFIAKGAEGKEAVFVTGRMDDPGLVERLHQQGGIVFSEVIPRKNSPLLNFILTWILPVVFFVAIGQLLARMMQKRMGGGMNAMQFGKSNAKIYVQAQTGKTFEDVAGEDEAKEASSSSMRLSTFCITRRNMLKSALPCPRARCLSALPERAKRCWRGR